MCMYGFVLLLYLSLLWGVIVFVKARHEFVCGVHSIWQRRNNIYIKYRKKSSQLTGGKKALVISLETY